MNLCLCGCGTEVKNKFASGHNSRVLGYFAGQFKKGNISWSSGLTKETSEILSIISKKVSIALTGKTTWNKGLTKENDARVLAYGIASGNSRKGRSKKQKEHIPHFCLCGCGTLVSRKWVLGHQNLGREFHHAEKSRKAMSESRKGKSFSDEHRKNISRALVGKPKTKEHNRKVGEANKVSVKRYYDENPEARELNSKRILDYYENNPEAIKLISKKSLENWQNPDYVAKQMKARGVFPNKEELWLQTIIQKVNSTWKYVGDGQLIIGGKCPDFWNGDHKLIELYGDYWHNGQNPQERIDFFKHYNYDCIVLWASELSNEDLVISKIKEFEG